MTVSAIIARYGLIAIFVGAGLEGETVVLAGGLLAHHGLLSLPGVLAAAAGGSFLADQIFFFIGRRYRNRGNLSQLRQRRGFARALSFLERHPTGFTLSFRFIYGLRTVSPLAIGTSSIPTARFILFNGIAATTWAIVIGGIGFGFGHGFSQVFAHLHKDLRFVLSLLVLLALCLIGAGVQRWRTRRTIRLD